MHVRCLRGAHVVQRVYRDRNERARAFLPAGSNRICLGGIQSPLASAVAMVGASGSRGISVAWTA